MKKINILLLFILMIISACTSTQEAGSPKGLDKFNASREVPEDMAVVYFFKPKVETTSSTKVLVNSVELANLTAGSYFHVYVPKGEVLIQAEQISVFGNETKNKIVYLEEGKSYFIGVGVKNEKSYVIPVTKSKEVKAKQEIVSYNYRRPSMTTLPLDVSKYAVNSASKRKLLSSSQAKTFDTAMEHLVSQLTDKIKGVPKLNIAILPFRTIGEEVEIVEVLLSEELTTRLVLTDKFNVVERNLLEKIMSENEFTHTGLVDEADAVEIGKLLGADLVCTGTIAPLSKIIKINSRIISTKTGRVVTAGATSISNSGF